MIKKEVKTRNRFSIKGNAKVKLQHKKLGKQIYLITWLTMWVGMLEILQNEQDLERRCQILQAELRSQDLDHQTEKLLLEELLRLVDLRDKLVSEQMNEEDLLCREESIGKEVQTCLISKTSKCQLQ